MDTKFKIAGDTVNTCCFTFAAIAATAALRRRREATRASGLQFQSPDANSMQTVLFD
jgi:hypothetical protein